MTAKRILSGCFVCKKTVASSHRALKCDNCHLWTHIKCDDSLSIKLYDALRDSPNSPFLYPCPICRPTASLNMSKVARVSIRTNTASPLPSVSVGSDPDIPVIITAETRYSPKPSKISSNNNVLDTNPKVLAPKKRRPKRPVSILAEEFTKTNLDTLQGSEMASTGSQCAVNIPQTVHCTSVIALNVPESTARELAVKEEDERSQWRKLCSEMGLPTVNPIRLVRLGRPEPGKARPLRITLSNEADTEQTILGSSLLATTSSQIRLYADVSWSERQARKQALQSVPLLNSADESQ